MTPLQAGKSRKTTIEREPFAAKLDRQRRVKSVWHKIAARISAKAQIDEIFPVSGSGCEQMHVLARTKVFQKFKRQSQRRRLLENLRMRDDLLSLLLARRRGFFGFKKR
jgi:hypothetical protein